MKSDVQEFENLQREYRLVYASYEQLISEMLACAADPDSKIEAYQSASQAAAKLFEQLAAMRKKMRNTHGRTDRITTETERPAYPDSIL